MSWADAFIFALLLAYVIWNLWRPVPGCRISYEDETCRICNAPKGWVPPTRTGYKVDPMGDWPPIPPPREH